MRAECETVAPPCRKRERPEENMNEPLRAFPMFAAAVLLAMAGTAPAQQFPVKPIRFVVPFSPGGGTDTLARLIAQKMTDSWGQSVVIENRTGAGGTIGAAIVAKATPDGHTLLVSSPGFVISAALQPNLPYNPLKDFVGVSQLGVSMSTLVVTRGRARCFSAPAGTAARRT
jgi:tripartite-type tricarboxylate transporter receptor subunit TctC